MTSYACDTHRHRRNSTMTTDVTHLVLYLNSDYSSLNQQNKCCTTLYCKKVKMAITSWVRHWAGTAYLSPPLLLSTFLREKKKKTPLKNMKKGLTGSLCCYSHHICRGTITSSSVCFHIQTEKLLMWSEPQQHMLVLNNSTERLKRHPAAKNEKYRSNVLTNNCSHFLRHPTTLKNFKHRGKADRHYQHLLNSLVRTLIIIKKI